MDQTVLSVREIMRDAARFEGETVVVRGFFLSVIECRREAENWARDDTTFLIDDDPEVSDHIAEQAEYDPQTCISVVIRQPLLLVNHGLSAWLGPTRFTYKNPATITGRIGKGVDESGGVSTRLQAQRMVVPGAYSLRERDRDLVIDIDW